MHQAGRGACQPASRPLGSAGLTAAFYRRSSRLYPQCYVAGHDRADHAAAVPRGRRRRGLARAGRGRVRLLPHRVVRGRRPARRRDQRLAGLDDHHPDVDLRHEGVTVRLITITRRLLRAERARRRAGPADLGGGARAGRARRPVRRADRPDHDRRARRPRGDAVLAGRARLRDRGDSPEDLIDPRGRGPSLWFQQMDAPRPQRNRIHVDVWVPHDQAEARVAAAIAAGGHLVTDQTRPRGGCWPTPRATRSTCAPGWAATERRHDTPGSWGAVRTFSTTSRPALRAAASGGRPRPAKTPRGPHGKMTPHSPTPLREVLQAGLQR